MTIHDALDSGRCLGAITTASTVAQEARHERYCQIVSREPVLYGRNGWLVPHDRPCVSLAVSWALHDIFDSGELHPIENKWLTPAECSVAEVDMSDAQTLEWDSFAGLFISWAVITVACLLSRCYFVHKGRVKRLKRTINNRMTRQVSSFGERIGRHPRGMAKRVLGAIHAVLDYLFVPADESAQDAATDEAGSKGGLGPTRLTYEQTMFQRAEQRLDRILEAQQAVSARLATLEQRKDEPQGARPFWLQSAVGEIFDAFQQESGQGKHVAFQQESGQGKSVPPAGFEAARGMDDESEPVLEGAQALETPLAAGRAVANHVTNRSGCEENLRTRRLHSRGRTRSKSRTKSASLTFSASALHGRMGTLVAADTARERTEILHFVRAVCARHAHLCRYSLLSSTNHSNSCVRFWAAWFYYVVRGN